MKLINAEKVSHIIVIKETQGAWSEWTGWKRFKYLPFRKHKWWEFDKETPEGYYENGINSHFSVSFSKQEIIQSNRFFLKDNEIYTRPQILIYLGKDLLHNEFFDTFAQLENHLKENYSKVNIKYGN